MRLIHPDRRAVGRLAELAIVLVLDHYIADWAVAAAVALHAPLPEIPLLRHTYVFFAFILLLFAYLRLRGERFSDFALVAPNRLLLQIGRAVLIFLAILLFDIAVRPLIDPIIAHLTGTSPTLAEQHFAPLKGNLGLLLYIIPAGWLFGGLGEEMLFRGYIMTRIAQVLGEGRGAWIAALFLQAIPFTIGHAYQGPVGMVGIYFAAVLYGTASLVWGRNLWPAIIAHGLLDSFGFWALYAGIAHT